MFSTEVQKFINDTIRKLAAQGPSAEVTPHGNVYCRLRGPGGTKCAIGLHVTDEQAAAFDPEGTEGMRDAIKMVEIETGIPHRVLKDLQYAHDVAATRVLQPIEPAYHPDHTDPVSQNDYRPKWKTALLEEARRFELLQPTFALDDDPISE